MQASRLVCRSHEPHLPSPAWGVQGDALERLADPSVRVHLPTLALAVAEEYRPACEFLALHPACEVAVEAVGVDEPGPAPEPTLATEQAAPEADVPEAVEPTPADAPGEEAEPVCEVCAAVLKPVEIQQSKLWRRALCAEDMRAYNDSRRATQVRSA